MNKRDPYLIVGVFLHAVEKQLCQLNYQIFVKGVGDVDFHYRMLAFHVTGFFSLLGKPAGSLAFPLIP